LSLVGLQGKLSVVLATGQATLALGKCNGEFHVPAETNADISLSVLAILSGRTPLESGCTHETLRDGPASLAIPGLAAKTWTVISNIPLVLRLVDHRSSPLLPTSPERIEDTVQACVAQSGDDKSSTYL
jgi:hypothetical protein